MKAYRKLKLRAHFNVRLVLGEYLLVLSLKLLQNLELFSLYKFAIILQD